MGQHLLLRLSRIDGTMSPTWGVLAKNQSVSNFIASALEPASCVAAIVAALFVTILPCTSSLARMRFVVFWHEIQVRLIPNSKRGTHDF